MASINYFSLVYAISQTFMTTCTVFKEALPGQKIKTTQLHTNTTPDDIIVRHSN